MFFFFFFIFFFHFFFCFLFLNSFLIFLQGTFNGLVPDAKLIFADMATGSANIVPPTSIADVFDLTYLRGLIQ